MRYLRSQWLFVGLLITAAMLSSMLLAGCSGFGSNAAASAETPSVGGPAPAIDTIVRQVLTNMHLHAWNPSAMTHGVVTGGLFINWRMDDPALTNATRPGPDGNAQHDHDPQVDLLYLTSLAEYQQLHPLDHTYDADLRRALTLVLADFQKYSLPKGWIYFYLLKDATMMHSNALLQEAHTVASNFYTVWYDPRLMFVYDRTHSPGAYNADHTLTCGAALIDAGLRWQQPQWVQAGENTIAHTITVALDPHYHLFYYGMTVTSDGRDRVANYKAKPDVQGQAVDALLTAYSLTHRRQYLDVASQVLHGLFVSSGLWDEQHSGFFFALDMRKGVVIPAYKETRGQSLVLLAVHHYNQLAQGQFAQQEEQLVNVLTGHFYQRTYHGFFYRLTPDFRIYVTRPGQGVGMEDYFTTEAMGGALDALQEVEMG